MMRRKYANILLLLSLILASNFLIAADSKAPFLRKISMHPFDATVTELKRAILESGMAILTEVEQKKSSPPPGVDALQAYSFEVDPQLKIPFAFRVYVWIDRNKKNEIGYFQPSVLLDRLDPGLQKPGQLLDKKIAKIVSSIMK